VTSKIAFQITNVENTFLDPRAGFQPTTVKSQVRTDPLTGRTGHFSHFGAIKPLKNYFMRAAWRGGKLCLFPICFRMTFTVQLSL